MQHVHCFVKESLSFLFMLTTAFTLSIVKKKILALSCLYFKSVVMQHIFKAHILLHYKNIKNFFQYS